MINEKSEETKQNIWQEILKEASTHKEQEEFHIYVLGDKNSGKKSLIKTINKELFLNYENEERTLPATEEANSRFALVDFKYLNVKKINDSENGK